VLFSNKAVHPITELHATAVERPACVLRLLLAHGLGQHGRGAAVIVGVAEILGRNGMLAGRERRNG
jgi:hypothetical protein